MVCFHCFGVKGESGDKREKLVKESPIDNKQNVKKPLTESDASVSPGAKSVEIIDIEDIARMKEELEAKVFDEHTEVNIEFVDTVDEKRPMTPLVGNEEVEDVVDVNLKIKFSSNERSEFDQMKVIDNDFHADNNVDNIVIGTTVVVETGTDKNDLKAEQENYGENVVAVGPIVEVEEEEDLEEKTITSLSDDEEVDEYKKASCDSPQPCSNEMEDVDLKVDSTKSSVSNWTKVRKSLKNLSENTLNDMSAKLFSSASPIKAKDDGKSRISVSSATLASLNDRTDVSPGSNVSKKAYSTGTRRAKSNSLLTIGEDALNMDKVSHWLLGGDTASQTRHDTSWTNYNENKYQNILLDPVTLGKQLYQQQKERRQSASAQPVWNEEMLFQ